MAEVRIAKPENGQSLNIPSEDGALFVFDFATGEATLSREGENLAIQFEDGSNVQIEGFYSRYNAENLPSFQMDGEEISAEDFFTAMNEPDLMPAAGPAAAAAATTGGRYRDYANASLLDGLQHLERLDWNMSRAFEPEDDPYILDNWTDDAAYAEPASAAVAANNPVHVTPINPGDIPSDAPDMPLPGGPDAPGASNAIPGAQGDILLIHEKELNGGNPVVKGGMNIDAPDGVGAITVGGVVVWENGVLTQGAEVRTDEGALSNFQFDPASGKLTYEFTLEQATQEHGQPGEDGISHSFQVTVTDSDGDSDSSYISVVIRDDVPQAEDDEASVKSGETTPIEGSLIVNDAFGADGKADVEYVKLISEPKGEYGTITLNPDGTYSFVLDNDNEAVKGLRPGETLTQQFEYQIKDADGDVSAATLTITINGTNNPVTITPDNPAPDNPDDPDSPVSASTGMVTVYDKHMPGGTEADADNVSASGSFTIEAKDGIDTIKVAGKIVVENGKLVEKEADRTFVTDEGELLITGLEGGKLTYTFTQTSPGEHQQGSDSISHEFTVVVKDLDGDSDTGYIKVNVMDDAPKAVDDKNCISEGTSEVAGDLLENDAFGADGKAESDYVQLVGDAAGKYGVLTLNPDGTYSYRLDNDNRDVQKLVENETLTETFKYEITDHDGNTSQATLTITIDGKNNPVTITPDNPAPDNPDDPDSPVSASTGMVTVYDKHMPGGTEADADNVSASGSFTIEAKDGIDTIKVAGKIVVENGKLVEKEADRTFVTDEGELRITGLEGGKLTYTFMQTSAGNHGNGDISHSFAVVVNDQDTDSATGYIKVNVMDDAPVVTGTKTDLSISETAGDAVVKDVSGSFTVQAGADGLKDGGASYSLNITNNAANLKALIGGKDAGDISLSYGNDAHTQVIGKTAAGVEIFRIDIDEGGKVSLTMTGNGTIKHAAGSDAALLEGVQAVKTVTDADGDSSSGFADLGISIGDSMATVTPGEVTITPVKGSSLSIDFTGATGGQIGSTATGFQSFLQGQDSNWNDLNATAWNNPVDNPTHSLINGSEVHYIFVNGIKIIASHVKYEINPDGHVYNFQDIGSGSEALGFSGLGGNKSLYLTGNGLGVGNKNNSAGNHEIGSSTMTPNDNVASNSGMAEAIVLEPQNFSVWYELNLTLNNFADGDRAMVYFYMTPQNNNDNNIVFAKEITKDDLVDGKVSIDMPDGFTKAIVAAMPNEYGGQSSFTLGKIDFYKNAVQHHSQARVDAAAADGVADIAWNWSALESQFAGKQVEIIDSINDGHYKVELTWDGTTVVAKLIALDGGKNLPQGSDILFQGFLNKDTGDWSIDQYYKFNVDGINENEIKFQINVTDGDGDVTTADAVVNMNPEVEFDRFQNVELGYWGDGWETDGSQDKAGDVLLGEGKNDLMFGRGGDDILFGDSTEQTADNLAEALWGEGHTMKVVDNTLSKPGAGVAGDNQAAGTGTEHTAADVWTALETLVNNKDWTKLDNVLEAIEKDTGSGDDALYGGLGNDILFGGKGDDFLSASKGAFGAPDLKGDHLKDGDMLFGGSGDDILVYGQDDVIIHGGSGIDVLLACGAGKSLAQMLEDNGDGPAVRDVEALIRFEDGKDVEKLGITSLKALKDRYDVTIDGDKGTIILGKDWQYNKEVDVWTNTVEGNKVTLEIHDKFGDPVRDADGNMTFRDSTMASNAQEQANGSIGYAMRGGMAETLESLPANVLDKLAKAYDLTTAASAAAMVGLLVDAINADPGVAAEIIAANDAEPAAYSHAESATAIQPAADVQPAVNEIATEYFADEAIIPLQTLGQNPDDILAETEIERSGFDEPEIQTDNVEIAPAAHGKPEAAIEGVNAQASAEKDGSDHVINGSSGDDILMGTDGDDFLFGGDGDDQLFGGAGNDFLDGGAGRDMLYGGEGNDLIVYDPSDYLIDGGEGIDVLLAGFDDVSLGELLTNKDPDKGAIVNDVEIMLKGDNIDSITNMHDLASLGIKIGADGKTVELSKDWKETGRETFGEGEGQVSVVTWENGGMTMETTLQISGNQAELEQATQTIMLSNG